MERGRDVGDHPHVFAVVHRLAPRFLPAALVDVDVAVVVFVAVVGVDVVVVIVQC